MKAAEVFTLVARWQRYLDALGQSEKTRKVYLRTLTASWCDLAMMGNPNSPMAYTEDDFVDVLAALPAKGAMRGLYVRAWRSFYGWAETHGGPESPVMRIKVPKRQRGHVRPLSAEQMRDLLDAAATMKDPRVAPAIALAFYTGGRVTSLCEARWSDVWEDRLHFKVAKGDRTYSVPLCPSGMDAARRLHELESFAPKGHTRRDTLYGVSPERFRQWLAEAGKLAGIEERVHPHMLRHTFGTLLRDADDITWMGLMGHSDTRQRPVYNHPSADREQSAVTVLEGV